jgi:hypothetical protein
VRKCKTTLLKAVEPCRWRRAKRRAKCSSSTADEEAGRGASSTSQKRPRRGSSRQGIEIRAWVVGKGLTHGLGYIGGEGAKRFTKAGSQLPGSQASPTSFLPLPPSLEQTNRTRKARSAQCKLPAQRTTPPVPVTTLTRNRPTSCLRALVMHIHFASRRLSQSPTNPVRSAL